MLVSRFQETCKATARGATASVKNMLPCFDSVEFQRSESASGLPKIHRALKPFLAISAIFALQFLALSPVAGAAAQSNAGPAQPPVPTISIALNESLRPALQQVGSSVSRIQIDHWKLSRSWKVQLQSDANSVQQDLAHQLPALLQQAQASPEDLAAQMSLMQNVDALYDVLVRLTLAADLTEKKTDAAMLDNALQDLESARKAAAAQLLQAASSQNQQIVHLQAQLAEGRARANVSGGGPKTIVVENDVTHRSRRRPTHHKAPTSTKPAPKSTPNATRSSTDKPPS